MYLELISRPHARLIERFAEKELQKACCETSTLHHEVLVLNLVGRLRDIRLA